MSAHSGVRIVALALFVLLPATTFAPMEKRLQDSCEITTLLIGQFKPSAILLSGTAGAVDPALFPGDVVIGKTVAQHDVGLQLADGLRRRGLRNAATSALDPLLVPASEPLLSVARSSSQGLKLPPVARRMVSSGRRGSSKA